MINQSKYPNIIFEDQDIIVCKKEAGVAVQTQKSTQPDMVSLLRNYRNSKKEDTYIGVIHRLDQPVEGLVIFAKHKKAADLLSNQIRQRSIEKQYYAILHGELEADSGELTDYLVKDGKTNLSYVATKETKDAKLAQLSFEKIAIKKNKTLIKIKLETGRHHQIRVQFSNMGYPLFGDTKYNAPKAGEYMPLGLCSCLIGFTHPTSKEKLSFSCKPVGKAFIDFAEFF